MNIRSNRNTFIAALAFVALSGISALSHANVPAEEPYSISVTYSKMDLQNKQGQDALYRKLRRAAEDVCDTEYSRLDERKCEKDALDRALEVLDHPALSALHRS